MASHIVVPDTEFASEMARVSKFKYSVILTQETEKSVISLQCCPGSHAKPRRSDITLAKQAVKEAESWDTLRHRLRSKLAAKARPKIESVGRLQDSHSIDE